MLAFIGSSELVLAAFVGLLLFGGRLPEVMRQVGRAWITLRRALNELKRESGLDETLAEIRRETDFASEARDWRRGMDHAAGPARDEPAEDAETAAEEPRPPAGGDPPADDEDRLVRTAEDADRRPRGAAEAGDDRADAPDAEARAGAPAEDPQAELDPHRGLADEADDESADPDAHRARE